MGHPRVAIVGMLPRSVIVVLLSCAPSAALRLPVHPAKVAEAGKAFLAAACSASLLAGVPHQAIAAPSLNEAIVEVSQTSYPILKALKAETFVPFSAKIGKLVLDIAPDKLGKSIELGVDVFLSVPPEKLAALNGVVKDSFAGLEATSCTLVPLPSAASANTFQEVATATVDAAKLKAFAEAYGPTLSALPRTEAAICLPPSAALEKLSLAQAEVGRSFGAAESKAFAAYTTPVLKGAVTISKVFPLLDDAKRLAPSATGQEKAAFQAAGKRIESAAKGEAMKANLAKQAAAREAAAANKPKPVDPAVTLAARQAAAAEQQAKSKAKQEAQAAQNKANAEALAARTKAQKEAAVLEAAEQVKSRAAAELARVAELKAKAAVIAEAKAAAKQ